MSLLKYFCNDIDSNKESDVAPASSSANALLPAKRRKTQEHKLIYDKNILLASLKMSHHMMKVKRPYTELERVVLPCLEIAADLIHGGKKQLIKSHKFRFPTLLLHDVVLLYPKI